MLALYAPNFLRSGQFAFVDAISSIATRTGDYRRGWLLGRKSTRNDIERAKIYGFLNDSRDTEYSVSNRGRTTASADSPALVSSPVGILYMTS